MARGKGSHDIGKARMEAKLDWRFDLIRSLWGKGKVSLPNRRLLMKQLAHDMNAAKQQKGSYGKG